MFACQNGFYSFELVWNASVIPQWQEKQPLGDPKLKINAYCGFVCVCTHACAYAQVHTCCLSIHVIGRTVHYEWFVMKFGVGGFTLKLWDEFYFLHSILSLHCFTLSGFSKMVHCKKKLLHLKFILMWWILYKITTKSNSYLCEILYCIYTLRLTYLYSYFFKLCIQTSKRPSTIKNAF